MSDIDRACYLTKKFLSATHSTSGSRGYNGIVQDHPDHDSALCAAEGEGVEGAGTDMLLSGMYMTV